MEPTHQLVFQSEATTQEDYDKLTALSLVIEQSLSSGSNLDGHDFGLGEYNVFIHTCAPVDIFEPLCELIDAQHPGISFSAGYRNFNEYEYTVLWPRSLTSFVVG